MISISSDTIRLLETNGEVGQYATLSHCWGKMTTSTRYRTTTQSTLEEKKCGIPITELPKTFRDAITICRGLSIPNIWIDSLCILQDSSDDWAREAAQMAEIYQNSIVTIAADGAEDGHGGCFVGKDRASRELEFKIPKAKGAPSTCIKVRQQRIRGRWDEVAHYKRLHPRSKLSTRAWVLQERLMPVSILHFTSAEMAWECATNLKCECKTEADPISMDAFTGSLISSRRPLSKSEEGEHLSHWYRLVEEFSQRRLTYESDRLPALSGLFSMVQKQTKRTYALGLWKEEMALGMMWRTRNTHHSGDEYPCKRQDTYCAPSWSWASVTGLIEYDRYVKNPPGKISQSIVYGRDVSLCVNLTGPNPFGPASSAYLNAEAYVVPVRLTKVEGTNEYLVVSERNVSSFILSEYRNVTLQPTLQHPSTTLTFQPLSQAKADERWKSDTRFDEPKQFFVTTDEQMMQYFNNILKMKGKKAYTPGERPYARLDADVKEGAGVELDLDQQYLVLLLGFTKEHIDDEAGTRVRVQAVVIGRDVDDLNTWKRIGRLNSIQYGWEDWSNISSPFKFRWV